MPIYEYECSNCHYQFEIIQKMSDEVLVDCPKCHTPKLKKLVSAAAFRLKGQGWYETDFKSENRKQLAGDETNPKKEGNESGAKESSADKRENKKPESSQSVKEVSGKQKSGSTGGGES